MAAKDDLERHYELKSKVDKLEFRLDQLEERTAWLDELDDFDDTEAGDFVTQMLNTVKLMKEAGPMLKQGISDLVTELEEDDEPKQVAAPKETVESEPAREAETA